MEIKGLDFSSGQGPNFPFGKAFGEGWAFAIGKVSGGRGYKNKFRETQFANAKAAGMETALYHYMFEPENEFGSGTPKQEFDNFRAAADRIVTDATPIVLDIEERSATYEPQPNLTEWLLEYQDLCMAEYGRYPAFYVGTYFIREMGLTDPRLTRSPLWLPSWQDTVPASGYWLPWTTLALWQYSSTAKIGGVQPVDANIYYGTTQEFKQLGRPTAPPPPASGPESIVASINADGNAVLTINFGGWVKDVKGYVVVDAGFSAIGNDGATYHRTVNPSGFQPWRKE